MSNSWGRRGSEGVEGLTSEADSLSGLHVHCILQGISTSWQVKGRDPGITPHWLVLKLSALEKETTFPNEPHM